MGTFVENVNKLATDLTTENITAINAVNGNITNVNTVAGLSTEINDLAARTAAIDSLYADKATLDSLFADKEKLDSLFADKVKLDSLYADKATLDSLYADKAGLDAVYANLAEILAADDNAAIATAKATEAQLKAWEAEAERMTADSYATEPEDVFVKVYTSNGDGTFSSTSTTEYSALHWNAKAATVVTAGVIDDAVPLTNRAYSSFKTQALHDAQATAIANLSGASASFYNNTTTVIPETPAAAIDLTWTNVTASSNSDIFELGINEIVFKQDGSYNFLNTLTYYRLSDGSIIDVTFELYDADTAVVLATYVQTIDMTAGTKETVPMNALLNITGASVADPVRMKVRMQASSASGTLELFSFNSILAIQSMAQNSLEIDATPTDGSNNPVSSNGVFDALAGKSDTGHTHSYLPLAGGTMTGAITALRETKVAMGANDIDLSAGNVFTKTISGATTLTVSNWLASGNANSFILELTNGGSAAVTYPSGSKFAGGTAPTLTASGKDILGCYSHDGGTTLNWIILGKDVK